MKMYLCTKYKVNYKMLCKTDINIFLDILEPLCNQDDGNYIFVSEDETILEIENKLFKKVIDKLSDKEEVETLKRESKYDTDIDDFIEVLQTIWREYDKDNNFIRIEFF